MERDQKKKFYITTPIYYPSDKLHIGHTYCTKASQAGVTPQQFVDNIVTGGEGRAGPVAAHEHLQ